ncbi:MAG: PKD domain-containing protein, partial [Methanoregula sp.]|nr:PKD domain-containing protein [Methanoregula sp.]
LGYGAGGGGGSSDETPTFTTQGGHGASGILRIVDFAEYTGNIPDFVADDTEISYGSIVHFTDLSTITESTDLTYNWSFGDGEYSSTVGNTHHVYAYMGSFDVSLSINSSAGEITELKPGYINVVSPDQVVTPYFPSTIKFSVVDQMGRAVDGARINATYVTSTFPSAVQYLTDMYHIDAAVAASMLSTGTTMTSLTGSDGAVAFSMHPSLQYNITVTSSQGNVNSLVYPTELTYTIWLPGTTVENRYEQINATLTFTEPNTSFFKLGSEYQDHAGKTTSLLFYVNTSNGTPVYSTSVSPGTTKQYLNTTIQNIRGQGFYWGIRGTRTGGNVSMDRGITAKGPNGVLVDLRLPNTSFYPWISIFLLFLITSLASKNNIRFFAILMPLMAAMFMYFGWFSSTYLVSVVPLCIFIGALYYMKGSLRDNYGVGGPGSMIVNIVTYLMIFQVVIGFISVLGIFNQSAMIAPSNQFSNVDLTEIKMNVSEIGGVNDPLQSATGIATMGWTTIKVLISMLGCVFVVGLFLSEMFPSVPIEFFAIIQALIYILYVLFIVKLLGKSGTETDL